MNSKEIDNFTLEIANEHNSKTQSGITACDQIKCRRIKEANDDYFHFQILENKEVLEKFLRDLKKPYHVRFHPNRSTFLAQHLALEYMKEHNLVECLINHEMYNKNMPENSVNVEEHLF